MQSPKCKICNIITVFFFILNVQFYTTYFQGVKTLNYVVSNGFCERTVTAEICFILFLVNSDFSDRWIFLYAYSVVQFFNSTLSTKAVTTTCKVCIERFIFLLLKIIKMNVSCIYRALQLCSVAIKCIVKRTAVSPLQPGDTSAFSFLPFSSQNSENKALRCKLVIVSWLVL